MSILTKPHYYDEAAAFEKLENASFGLMVRFARSVEMNTRPGRKSMRSKASVQSRRKRTRKALSVTV